MSEKEWRRKAVFDMVALGAWTLADAGSIWNCPPVNAGEPIGGTGRRGMRVWYTVAGAGALTVRPTQK